MASLTPTLTSYSFDQVLVTVNGQSIDGFVEGTAIEITREEDSWTYEKGNDGRVCRSKMLASVYKVTLTLMSSSYSNDFLSLLHLADYAVSTNNLLALTVTNAPNGKSIFMSKDAWISRAPDVTYDRVSTSRVWTFTAVPLMDKAAMFVGGQG